MRKEKGRAEKRTGKWGAAEFNEVTTPPPPPPPPIIRLGQPPLEPPPEGGMSVGQDAQ